MSECRNRRCRLRICLCCLVLSCPGLLREVEAHASMRTRSHTSSTHGIQNGDAHSGGHRRGITPATAEIAAEAIAAAVEAKIEARARAPVHARSQAEAERAAALPKDEQLYSLPSCAPAILQRTSTVPLTVDTSKNPSTQTKNTTFALLNCVSVTHYTKTPSRLAVTSSRLQSHGLTDHAVVVTSFEQEEMTPEVVDCFFGKDDSWPLLRPGEQSLVLKFLHGYIPTKPS